MCLGLWKDFIRFRKQEQKNRLTDKNEKGEIEYIQDGS